MAALDGHYGSIHSGLHNAYQPHFLSINVKITSVHFMISFKMEENGKSCRILCGLHQDPLLCMKWSGQIKLSSECDPPDPKTDKLWHIAAFLWPVCGTFLWDSLYEILLYFFITNWISQHSYFSNLRPFVCLCLTAEMIHTRVPQRNVCSAYYKQQLFSHRK